MTTARVLAASFLLACAAFCAFLGTLWWVVYVLAPIGALLAFAAILLAVGARPVDRAALYMVAAGLFTLAALALFVLRR